MNKTSYSITQQKRRYRRRLTALFVILFFFLLFLVYWVQQKDAAKPGDDKTDLPLGTISIDMQERAGFGRKIISFPFERATTFQPGGAADALFNEAVLDAGMTIENATARPLNLQLSLSTYASVDTATGTRMGCPNPGLHYFLYYYDVSALQDAAFHSPAEDYLAYLQAQGTNWVYTQNESGITQLALPQTEPVPLQPGHAYQFVWVFWVDKEAQPVPASADSYGITVEAVTRYQA